MATAKEVVDYAWSLLNKKVTVPTNPYGGQCVAFNDHIIQHFSDKNLAYTNAKDTLTKAASQGLIVIYNDHPDKYPEPGDSIVYQWGDDDPFGHIGIVIEATPTKLHTLEQNVDGWRDENGNGQNDQLEYGGGGYVREMNRNVSDYQYVKGWFRLKYDEPKPKEKKDEEFDMITISAPGRGIAVVMGGKFLPILDAKIPTEFWNKGVKHFQLDQKTFDAWQGKAEPSSLDDATVMKLIDGIKK